MRVLPLYPLVARQFFDLCKIIEVTNQLKDRVKRMVKINRSQTISMPISEVTTKAETEATTQNKSCPLRPGDVVIFSLWCQSRENRNCFILRKSRYLRKELLGGLSSISGF
jgi:hypothetical protein